MAPLFGHVRAFFLTESDLILQTDPGAIWADLIREKKDPLEQMAAEFFGRSLKIAVKEETLAAGFPWSVLEGVQGQTEADPIVKTALHMLNAKIEEVTP